MAAQSPGNDRKQSDFRAASGVQVSEVTELRGATSRQDAEVRQLREENRGLAQKAALVGTLGADCASLQQRVSSDPVGGLRPCFPSRAQFVCFFAGSTRAGACP